MRESVAVAKEADAKKGFSPTKSDNSIHRVRDEPERQLGSLRSVIGNIRRDGGTPSVDSIATELSGVHATQRAPALLALQQTHGNRYVQRVVAGIQAKLKVGQPGDKYEQEADRVADQVLQMPEPKVQRVCSYDGGCRSKVEQLGSKMALVQAKHGQESATEVSEVPPIVPEVIRSPGRPLDRSTRAFFEPRFGYDFSRVRVHADARSAQAARAVNARAFTVGKDIVFGVGQYAPGTINEQRLLAHELTHVGQQNAQNTIRRFFTEEDEGTELEREEHGGGPGRAVTEFVTERVQSESSRAAIAAIRFRTPRDVSLGPRMPRVGMMVEVTFVPGRAPRSDIEATGPRRPRIAVFPRTAVTRDMVRRTTFAARAVLEAHQNIVNWHGLQVELIGRALVWERGSNPSEATGRMDILHVGQLRLRLQGRLHPDNADHWSHWFGEWAEDAAAFCRSRNFYPQVNIQAEISLRADDAARLATYHRALGRWEQNARALDNASQHRGGIQRMLRANQRRLRDLRAMRSASRRPPLLERQINEAFRRHGRLLQDLNRADRRIGELSRAVSQSDRAVREAAEQVPEHLRGLRNRMARRVFRRLGSRLLASIGRVLAGVGIVLDLAETALYIGALATGRAIVDPERAGETERMAVTPGEEGEAAGSHEREGEGEDGEERVHVESAEVDTGGGAAEGHTAEHEEGGTSVEEREEGAEASEEGTITEAVEQRQSEEGGSIRNPYEEARQRADELRRVRFQESALRHMIHEVAMQHRGSPYFTPTEEIRGVPRRGQQIEGRLVVERNQRVIGGYVRIQVLGVSVEGTRYRITRIRIPAFGGYDADGNSVMVVSHTSRIEITTFRRPTGGGE